MRCSNCFTTTTLLLTIIWMMHHLRTTQGFGAAIRSKRPITSMRLTSTQLYDKAGEDMVNQLLGNVIRRATSTLSTKSSEATSTSISTSPTNTNQTTTSNNNNNKKKKKKKKAPAPKLMYRENPAITNTALAHTLWSAIIRPHIDTAIDATCGNGHDSLALARMLFPNKSAEDSQSRLVCIDVQKRACENTKKALADDFAHFLANDRIQILQESHSPLPLSWASDKDTDLSSVSLVVYNLGWLPSNEQDSAGKTTCITQMNTTLQSIVDSMLLLRIGGMLSVVTYPKTNAQEDLAVRTFLECAALLSSNVQTWQDFLVETMGQQTTTEGTMKEAVVSSMERLVEEGSPAQTWRVSEHKKLGMDRAPILLTATRIK